MLTGANLGAFVVAFTAGAAGLVALGRAKSGAVVGVLVSITTIPSAANVGVALAMGNGSEALRSFTLLIVNLLGLLAGGLLTLLMTRAWARRIEGGRARFRPKSARGPERSPTFAWASDPRNHPVGVMLRNASGRFIPERTDVLAHRGGRTAM